MFKFVIAAVLAATAMVGFTGATFADQLPAYVVGKWVYRDYDTVQKKDKENGYTTTWEISKDGTGKAEDGASGKVTSSAKDQITLPFENGDYKGEITWDPRTNIGEINFTGAPNGSPKQKFKGPYYISMRRK
jgi:hypothetical protein